MNLNKKKEPPQNLFVGIWAFFQYGGYYLLYSFFMLIFQKPAVAPGCNWTASLVVLTVKIFWPYLIQPLCSLFLFPKIPLTLLNNANQICVSRSSSSLTLSESLITNLVCPDHPFFYTLVPYMILSMVEKLIHRQTK